MKITNKPLEFLLYFQHMKTITICGSMKFSKQMQKLKSILEEKGYVVLIPDIKENNKLVKELSNLEMNKIKRGFIQNHFLKIIKADAIIVANYDKKGIKGYIGSNTLMEIAIAFSYGKIIYILNQLGRQNCLEEVEALTDLNLRGDIGLL